MSVERRFNNLLLGATRDSEIVFADVEIRKTEDNRSILSVCFQSVRPFNVDEIDLEELAESYLECFDKGQLYDFCERYDCSPSNLVGEFADDCTYEDLMDCSLYPYELEADNGTYAFESGGCGQHDATEEMEFYTNEKAFCDLIDFWKEFHLSEISEKSLARLMKVINKLESVDTDEWLIDFINENM